MLSGLATAELLPLVETTSNCSKTYATLASVAGLQLVLDVLLHPLLPLPIATLLRPLPLSLSLNPIPHPPEPTPQLLVRLTPQHRLRGNLQRPFLLLEALEVLV